MEGKRGVKHSCHLPGAGGLEGKRLLTTSGERTDEENSHGEVSRVGVTLGTPLHFTEDEPKAERLGEG